MPCLQKDDGAVLQVEIQIEKDRDSVDAPCPQRPLDRRLHWWRNVGGIEGVSAEITTGDGQ